MWPIFLDKVLEYLPTKPRFVPREDKIRVAILGRPNAGKSTMVNSLVGEDRVITSAIAGTTRDAIDTEFEWEGRKIVLTDTAGLRKKARVKDEVEYFSNMRALEAVRRSDVCVLLVDSVRGMEIQDFRICTLIQEVGKGLIICLEQMGCHGRRRQNLRPYGEGAAPEKSRSRRFPFPLRFRPYRQTAGPRAGRNRQGEGEPGPRAGPRERDPLLRGVDRQASASGLFPGPGHLAAVLPGLDQSARLGFRGQRTRNASSRPTFATYAARLTTFSAIEGAPLRIWFRSRFKLRTDEDLLSYLHWGNIPEDVRAEWLDEERKLIRRAREGATSGYGFGSGRRILGRGGTGGRPGKGEASDGCRARAHRRRPIAAYFLGALAPALWMARLHGVDIFKVGSGNPGMTNVWRTLGWKPALPVALLDAGKGYLAVWLAIRLTGSPAWGLACGVIAVLGHSFTCFARFRGGKGVLTTFGVFLYFAPVSALVGTVGVDARSCGARAT